MNSKVSVIYSVNGVSYPFDVRYFLQIDLTLLRENNISRILFMSMGCISFSVGENSLYMCQISREQIYKYQQKVSILFRTGTK